MVPTLLRRGSGRFGVESVLFEAVARDRTISVIPPCLTGLVFDMRDHLDQLRCRPTEWLSARRVELLREQRRLRVEELAVTRVLDERDALDESAAADGVSERTAAKPRRPPGRWRTCRRWRTPRTRAG
jgi:hypothetical protein